MNEKMMELARALREVCPGLELRENEPMSRHTSFRVGGPAALMALPKTKFEAAQAVKTARAHGITPFFLGNGSNLLVRDEGYEGFLIKPAGGEFGEIREVNGQLVSGSAVTLARLAVAALDRGLTGLEFAHGIPGTVGGGVFMNAGAYGGEMAQVVTEVTCLNESGEVEKVTEFDFSYRHSAFSDGRRMILSAAFKLEQGDRDAIKARMDELAAQRQSKQPLEYPSAGSMFKRPVGYFAGALIEQNGLKGFTVGGAQVSEKHAGFVINRGGATCADVLELVRQVQEKVKAANGVELEMEVRVLR